MKNEGHYVQADDLSREVGAPSRGTTDATGGATAESINSFQITDSFAA
jgi:hypothetical protein